MANDKENMEKTVLENENNGINNEQQEQTEKEKRRKIKQNKKLSLVAGMLVVVAIVAGAAIWGLLHLKPVDKTVQGQADCEVVRISGKLGGRVVEIYVQEGDYVHEGQKLAKIYSSTTDASLSRAQAMRNAAASENRKVQQGTRQELINSAQKMLEQAQAAEEIARKTYERTNNLYNEGVVSAQRRDEAKAALDAATAAVATAKSQLEMAKNGPQAEDRAASRNMEYAAQASVREVEALLEDQYLIAPCDGEVSSIYPHVGELVIMGAPIMTISLLDDMWATFNVREERLNDLEMGKEITVKIPALGNKEAKMKIYHVNDMGSFATWGATKAYGDYDSKTFEIKARPVQPIENFRPGMSVILK